jgi:hypothetical protein
MLHDIAVSIRPGGSHGHQQLKLTKISITPAPRVKEWQNDSRLSKAPTEKMEIHQVKIYCRCENRPHLDYATRICSEYSTLTKTK